jgi:hypothetical protein
MHAIKQYTTQVKLIPQQNNILTREKTEQRNTGGLERNCSPNTVCMWSAHSSLDPLLI